MIKSASRSSIANNEKFRSMSVGNVPSSEFLIQTIEISTPVTNFSFDNLAQFVGVYKHLQVVYSVRSNRAATTDALVMRFTAASGSHVGHFLSGNGSTVSSFADTSGPHIYLGDVLAGSSIAGTFTAGIIDILDPYASKNKTIRHLGGQTGSNNSILFSSGLFFGSTAAISSLFFVSANGANLSVGTRFSLYGVTA